MGLGYGYPAGVTDRTIDHAMRSESDWMDVLPRSAVDMVISLTKERDEAQKELDSILALPEEETTHDLEDRGMYLENTVIASCNREIENIMGAYDCD